VLTRLNTRAIDTGTSRSIELRTDPTAATAPNTTIGAAPLVPVSPTTAANAAAAMVQQMNQQAAPPAQPVNRPPVMPPVTFTMLPTTASQAVGSTFQVAVVAANTRDLYSVPMQIQFNSAVLDLVNVDAGGLLSSDGQPVALVHRDEGNGLLTISTSRPPGVAGVSGSGNVCTLTFKAKAAGDSNVTLVKVGANDSKQQSQPAVGSQAVVHVK
jgi:general secretion pathway protein D